MSRKPVVLTIAGSDPSGGAGIQADLRTIRDLGAVGVSVITAITAQNTLGVQYSHIVGTDVVQIQLTNLLSDIKVDAVKIGMLGSRSNIKIVARFLAEFGATNIVLDPVLFSSSGKELLAAPARRDLVDRLFPVADLVTPNLSEADLLYDLEDGEVGDDDDSDLTVPFGAKAVLIKGGHLDGDPYDTLHLPGQKPTVFPGSRVPTDHTHGTGCFLSTAIATYLAYGMPMIDAIRAAKQRMEEALQNPVVIGQGIGYPALSSRGL